MSSPTQDDLEAAKIKEDKRIMELALSCKAGGPATKSASTELYNRYCRDVKRFLRFCLRGREEWLRQRPHVDDVSQNVWLTVLIEISEFKGLSKFKTWLFTITRRTCSKSAVKEMRANRTVRVQTESGEGVVPLDEVARDGADAVPDQADNNALLPKVKEAVALIEQSDRVLLYLRFVDMHSWSEVAEINGEGVAKARGAWEKLQSLLAKELLSWKRETV